MHLQKEGFGDFFRRLRRAKGFKSQKSLAEASGVSQSTISRIEDGTQTPQPETLKLLSNTLGVSYTELMVLAGHWSEDELLEPIDVDKILSEKNTLETPSHNENEKEFLRKIELSDEKLLEEFEFTLDGQKLTEEEAKGIIAYLRSFRQLRK